MCYEQAQPRTSSDAQSQRTHIEQQGRPEVEMQRREIEEESKKRLDKEAIAAIEQTQGAVEAIGRGQLVQQRSTVGWLEPCDTGGTGFEQRRSRLACLNSIASLN